MANNSKQCFNTHYQSHCHPTTKSLWLCSSVYCRPPHQSRRIYQPKTHWGALKRKCPHFGIFITDCNGSYWVLLQLPGQPVMKMSVSVRMAVKTESCYEANFVGCCRFLGAVSIRKTVLPGMAIPMLKIRRPIDRLIFNMGIAIRR